MKKILLSLLTVIVLFSRLIAYAWAEGNLPKDKNGIPLDPNCAVYLDSIIQKNEPEMENYIKQQLTNSSPTSDLIDDTMTKFTTYIDILDASLHEDWAGAYQSNSDIMSQGDMLATCDAIIDGQSERWSNVIRETVMQTSIAKETNLLLIVYKRINAKLSELNIMLGYLKACIDGFGLNLPCYVKKCVTQ